MVSSELSFASHRASDEFQGETSVEAYRVSKVYWEGGKELQILKDVSLSLRKGETVAVLGPSGSGKTTLLNILSGLDRATEGSARLCGVDIGKLTEAERADFRNRHLGFVFQFYHLLPEFTALENVLLPALLGKRLVPRPRIREKAAELLVRVGLRDRMGHYPSELSGGEQQRVAIARALVNDPDVLFCDEPTGNLDASTGKEIAKLLGDFVGNKEKCLLLVTHDPEIARMATKIWSIVKKDWV